MKKTKSIKIIKVCPPEECNNQFFTGIVKGKEMTFCCKKGFQTSLDDFSINLASYEHAKKILGEEQFNKNKDAANVIASDFESGANWYRESVKGKLAQSDEWDHLEGVIGELYLWDKKGEPIADSVQLDLVGEKAAEAFGYPIP